MHEIRRSSRRAAVLVGMALGLASAHDALAAQAVPADRDAPANKTDTGDIVVVGRDNTSEARVRALATRITRDASPGIPMARFADPVCFSVRGLPPSVSGVFLKRLADNAAQIGVDVLKDGCKPNLVVVFTDDGREDIRMTRKKRPWLFGDLAPYEIDRSINEAGPVHSWANIVTRPSDGTRYVTVASIIDLPVRRDILSTVILIDRPAAIGKTVHQLADYATMRGLAVIRTAGLRRDEDTILALFGDDRRGLPAGLTPFDRGYLKELYAGDGNAKTAVKLVQIARRVANDPTIR